MIAEGFNRNLTATEIEEGLSRIFAASVDVAEETAIQTAAAQQQSYNDQNIAVTMAMVSEQIKQSMAQMASIAELRRVVSDLGNAESERLRLAADKEQELRKVISDIQTSEAERVRLNEEKEKELVERIAKLEEKKSFWQRLFGG